MATCLMSLDDRGVARLSLHRPERHNALNADLLREFTEHLRAVAQNPAVRVLVVAGSGASFCAGADIDWMRHGAGQSAAEHAADARLLMTLLRELAALPQPTIAVVAGAAMGGGVGLVAACDLAIAAADARFGLTEVRLGLIPAVIGPYVLAAVGRRACQRWMLTGERFTAQQAQSMGLLHEVVPAEQLADVLEQCVAALLAGAPGAQSAVKQLLQELGGGADTLLELTVQRNAERRMSAEGQEGVAAFLQKRPPNWV